MGLIDWDYLLTLNQRVQGSSPCAPTTQLHSNGDFPGFWRESPNWRAFARALGLCERPPGFQGRFRRLCLWPSQFRFPGNGDARGQRLGSNTELLGRKEPLRRIAYDLGISERTVEVHRSRMMKQLGVRHLFEAIRIAILAGLARTR
jgi:hypothetical protein